MIYNKLMFKYVKQFRKVDRVLKCRDNSSEFYVFVSDKTDIRNVKTKDVVVGRNYATGSDI